MCRLCVGGAGGGREDIFGSSWVPGPSWNLPLPLNEPPKPTPNTNPNPETETETQNTQSLKSLGLLPNLVHIFWMQVDFVLTTLAYTRMLCDNNLTLF